MSEILTIANKLALIAKYPGQIQPITEWKRPTELVQVSGFPFIKIGCLTSAESCVINVIRSKINLSIMSQRKAILTELAKISERLGIENEFELRSLLADEAAMTAVREENNIEVQEMLQWHDDLQEASNSVDIQAVIKESRNLTITFMAAMRCNPDWDLIDTMQLSEAEGIAILDFIEEEEGTVNEPEEVDKEITVKKP